MSTSKAIPDNKDHLRALHAAYVAASGFAVSFSPQREDTCRELHRRGITPDDVTAVIEGIKAHIKRGTHGYSDLTLEWRNAIGFQRSVDMFEERALKARQAKALRAGAKRPPAVLQAKNFPDGTTAQVTLPAKVPEVTPIGGNVAQQLAAFRRQMKGDAS